MNGKATDLPPQTIAGYLASCPEPARERLLLLIDMVRTEVPQAKERIAWGMPTFSLEGDIISFMAARGHIGFYPGPSGVQHFLEKGGVAPTAKGTIRLSYTKPLPLDVLREVVRFRVEENKALTQEKIRKKKQKMHD